MNKSTGIIIAIIILVVVGGFVYFKNNDRTKSPVLNEDNSMKTEDNTVLEQTSTTSTTTTTGTTANSYTLAQISTHKDATSCWSTINGGVYDLTTWIGGHPGGVQAILSICGKDGSAAFNGQHGGQKMQENKLATFKIGVLIK